MPPRTYTTVLEFAVAVLGLVGVPLATVVLLLYLLQPQ